MPERAVGGRFGASARGDLTALEREFRQRQRAASLSFLRGLRPFPDRAFAAGTSGLRRVEGKVVDGEEVGVDAGGVRQAGGAGGRDAAFACVLARR